MSQRLKLEVKALNAAEGPDLVVLVSDRLVLSPAAEALAGSAAQALLERAAAAENYKGKAYAGLTVPAPEG
ncbi:hypothetical protein ACIPIA_09905, partial [Bosea sp. CER48]